MKSRRDIVIILLAINAVLTWAVMVVLGVQLITYLSDGMKLREATVARNAINTIRQAKIDSAWNAWHPEDPMPITPPELRTDTEWKTPIPTKPKESSLISFSQIDLIPQKEILSYGGLGILVLILLIIVYVLYRDGRVDKKLRDESEKEDRVVLTKLAVLLEHLERRMQ